MYLDNAATTQLTEEVKQYIIDLLDVYQNPSSTYQSGINVKNIINKARESVAKFINGKSDNIIFTSSGSSANTLAIKGLTSENPQLNEYRVYYSPTAHKSMIKSCESCLCHDSLLVNQYGEIDLKYLDSILKNENKYKPLVCVEIANSEIGTINDMIGICNIVHKYNGLVIADATGYIPSYNIDMNLLNCDFLTFSGHKLHALKGVGVLYINTDIDLKPLVYGSQEHGLFAGTENVLGIASLGKSVENYGYSSISSKNRDYVYDYITNNIPDSYLVGAPFENRLPHNLYMCFKGILGESLMILLDMNNIQISTGSACSSGDLNPSTTLTAIGIDKNDIHSCIRMTFSGTETKEELNYVCKKLKECIGLLRSYNEK